MKFNATIPAKKLKIRYQVYNLDLRRRQNAVHFVLRLKNKTGEENIDKKCE